MQWLCPRISGADFSVNGYAPEIIYNPQTSRYSLLVCCESSMVAEAEENELYEPFEGQTFDSCKNWL